MRLVLNIDGNQKTFYSKWVPMDALRRLMELQTRVDLTFITEPKDLDEVIQQVCDLFGNQFSADQLYKGVSSRDFMGTVLPEFIATVNGVIGDGDSKKKSAPRKTTKGSRNSTQPLKNRDKA